MSYYDYTVKWYSLINCNLCVWLDIGHILALNEMLKFKNIQEDLGIRMNPY